MGNRPEDPDDVMEQLAGNTEKLTVNGKTKGSQDKVKAGQNKVKASQDKVKAGQDKVKAGQDNVKAGKDIVKTGQDSVKAGQDSIRAGHMKLLHDEADDDTGDELSVAPIFTGKVLSHAKNAKGKLNRGPLSQYGLLAGIVECPYTKAQGDGPIPEDPRVFYNTVSPSSTFICGSQGSGKSHTLACILENCLIPSAAAYLPRPLTGLVFHYDPWSSDSAGAPCEVAYLASNDKVKVRVLAPPSNIIQIKRIYEKLPQVEVEELRINQSDINSRRMLDMMAVSSVQGGSLPLYLHVISRIARDLRIEQQNNGTTFNYRDFKRLAMGENLTPGQSGPLQQRFDTLESFLVPEQVVLATHSRPNKGKGAKGTGNDWTPKAGQLTIVDLSCPCVTAELACSLFNICLSLFTEQSTEVGRVVALDEAHKYMQDSTECQILTEALLSSIRQQRHQAMRVIIATQEPTISPKLLDLCSVTIVHRFTSPDWLQVLRKHLAGASILAQARGLAGDEDDEAGFKDPVDLTAALFGRIVSLRRGEALMFAPSAIIGVENTKVSAGKQDAKLVKLGHRILRLRVRKRITEDGGRSILAA